eukprot:1267701-Alexandrium_andersonii.AAC.1
MRQESITLICCTRKGQGERLLRGREKQGARASRCSASSKCTRALCRAHRTRAPFRCRFLGSRGG